MPAKKETAGKKTVEKQKQKVIEDKTFGLKNKKGKKQQEFIKNVHNQIKGTSNKQLEMERRKKKEMELELEAMKEIGPLIKPVVKKQQVEPGVDPKSILCTYFKVGACTRGDKCKFSHDLSIERKVEKKDIYCDARETGEGKSGFDRELDLEALESIIEKKHGKANKNSSEKICKYFLEAVEKQLYGWFWVCPNGGDSCQYKHALPPGYVLKRDRVQPTQQEETPIEEIIENQRANLEGELTRINEETFKIWKASKIKQKKDKLEMEMKRKREEMLSGNVTSKITGKDAFVLDPTLITQDDEEADVEIIHEANEENVRPYEEIITEKMAKLQVADEVATKSFSLLPKQRIMGPSVPQ